MYKKPFKQQFHIFTNNYDEYCTTKKEAYKIAKQLLEENDCVRIYHQTEWNKYDGVFEDGDCIYSKGEFPT